MHQIMFVGRVDRQYRITIPSAARAVLNVSPGDYFEVTITKVSSDDSIEKRKGTPLLQGRGGIALIHLHSIAKYLFS